MSALGLEDRVVPRAQRLGFSWIDNQQLQTRVSQTLESNWQLEGCLAVIAQGPDSRRRCSDKEALGWTLDTNLGPVMGEAEENK